MKFIGWITIFLLGIAVINMIAYRIKIAEKIAFALPIGLGINSLLFFIADLLYFSLQSVIIIIGIELMLCILLSIITVRIRKPAFSLEYIPKKIDLKKFPLLNLAWIFFMGLILITTSILTYKSLYWPISQFDSIAGYDFVAKALAKEGTLNNSIFSLENPIYTIRSIYPPLAPISFGFAYLIGHTSSQIVVLMFFFSTITSFYLLLKRNSTHLCAAFFTLLLIVIPEYAAFSTISSSNVPCVFYTSIGILCLYIWHTEQDQNYFTIGVLLISFAVWTRSEAIVFAVGGGILILLNAISKKRKIYLTIFSISCLTALFLWQWYIGAILNVPSAQPLLSQLNWDSAKLARMLNQIKLVTFSSQYYGATVLLFITMIIINLKHIIMNKDNVILLISIFSSFIIYVSIFYLIDTDYTNNTMEGWIFSGYKRGLFCFFPLMLFYSANNKISRKLFNEYLTLIPSSKK